MGRVLYHLSVVGALLLLMTSLSYAQIHKVKISELKERIADGSPRNGREIEYQPNIVTNPIFTNSPGTVVGSTWWEYQHNGTMSRMIALDSSEGIHFNWMNGLESDPESDRYVDYNYLDPTGSWLGAVHVTPSGAGGGFTGIAGILPDGRELLCFHQNCARYPEDAAWWSTLAIEKAVGGVGSFYRYDIPDSLPGWDYRVIWPRAAIDSLNTVHVVMRAYNVTTFPLIINGFGYTRCYVDDTTLVCEAPGLDTVRILPDTLMSYPNANLVAIFDSSGTISHTVVASPVSRKVAIIYTKYTNPDYHEFSGDVYYIESTNSGQDWIDAGGFETIEKHNLTNYTIDDTIRAYHDVASVYDYDDNLHILWTTHGYWEEQDSVTTDACFLWHWSEFSGITLVADGWEASRPGDLNRTISKMSIGVNPANNYLYATWTQFDSSDTASNGYSNGEIYASASSDGGQTWGLPRNLTNTHTPGCQAGDCESDHWSSLAEIVKDTLHIQYINDKDPGFWQLDEGLPTNNPVLYLKVPAWPPFLRGDVNGDGQIDIADVVYLINYLFIDGPAPDPLWVGDANCDDVVNIADVVYLINYLFIDGPSPDC